MIAISHGSIKLPEVVLLSGWAGRKFFFLGKSSARSAKWCSPAFAGGHRKGIARATGPSRGTRFQATRSRLLTWRGG